MRLQGKGFLYAVTYPLLSTVKFRAVFLVLTVNHPHSRSEYTHRRLSQFCQNARHAKEMEGQGGKSGRYWRNLQTLVWSGFCLFLFFESYPFAFWTVGNMIRDEFNGDLFMSDALLYWREESLEAHSSFRSLSFLGEWHWDLNWDGIHFQRRRDGAQIYSRLDKGERAWLRFIGLELKRHKLYGTSGKFCLSVKITGNIWWHLVQDTKLALNYSSVYFSVWERETEVERDRDTQRRWEIRRENYGHSWTKLHVRRSEDNFWDQFLPSALLSFSTCLVRATVLRGPGLLASGLPGDSSVSSSHLLSGVLGLEMCTSTPVFYCGL